MSGVDERLEPIRQRFRARLAKDAFHLRSLLQTEQSPERDDEIEMIVHKIAGFAGSVGFAELGQAAKHLDEVFSRTQNTSTSNRRELEAFLSNLEHEAVRDE